MYPFLRKKLIHTKKNSSGFNLFLFSYIIILLTPIITTAFGYWYSYKTIQHDAYLYQTTLLHQSKTVFDQIFKQINSGNKLIASNSLTASLGKKAIWESKDLFTVVELRDELFNLKQNETYVDETGIYFHKNNSFITSEKRYASEVAHIYLNKLNFSLEEFINSTSKVEGYFLLQKGNNTKILYYRNTYFNNNKNKMATSYIIIQCSELMQEVRSFALHENSGLFMLNKRNQILWNSQPEIDVAPINNTFLSGNKNMKFIQLNKNKYIIGTIESDIIEGQYVIYTPKKIFFQNISYLKYIILIEITLSIGLGLLLAYYFTRKNYEPIEKMISLITTQKDGNMDKTITNSYKSLEAALRTLLKDNHALQKKLHDSDMQVMEGLLTCFMKGLYTNEEKITNFLKQKSNMSDTPAYHVVLFSFKNIEYLSLFKDEERISETYDIFIFSVINIINEILLGDTQKGFSVEIDNMVACIIPCNHQQGFAFRQNIQKCIYFFKDAFDLETYASVSDEHSHWTELSIAYEEAFMANAHKTFWGQEINDIVFYMEESALESGYHQHNPLPEQQKKLSNCIFTRKYREASKVLDEILDGCFSKDLRYMSYNQCQASAIIGIVLDNLNWTGFNESKKENTIDIQCKYYQRLLSTKSILSLKTEIHKILDEIIESQEQKHLGEPEWLEKVKAYIEYNYHNPNINIAHIADKFSMSESYLGSTFKKIERMSMLDYIHLLRIKECQALLLQGKTLKHCVDAVGYANVKTLIRAFKRYEGITPGQYRTNHKIMQGELE